MSVTHSLKFHTMPAAAIIGALGGIAQGAINQAIGNAANLRAQKELYNYTLPREQEAQYNMIKMSPRLQVEGMKAAGLNPASINGGYQGAAVSGDTSANTQPLQIDAVGAAMQAAQMEMNEKMNAANVRKTNAEAQNVEKQNQWFDALNQQNLNTAKAQEDLLKNQSKEIQDLLPGKIKEQSSNINLLDLKASYQQSLNDAMEKEYDFDGKKVKGKDIPNFKELYALEMANKTLEVDWFNAITSRQGIERDWKAVLTKEWFAPLIKSLSGDVSNLSPQVRQVFQNTLRNVENMLKTIEDVQNDVQPFTDFLSNPYGSTKKFFKEKTDEALSPFRNWYNKLKENTRNGKYF